jgi:hypothetical protein
MLRALARGAYESLPSTAWIYAAAVVRRDAVCDGWQGMDGRRHMRDLCTACGYVPPPVPDEPLITPELQDLILGTCVVALIIGVFASHESRVLLFRRRRAMSRSLSCPALVELKSKRAIDACADMLVAFESMDERHQPKRIPRAQSLETLPEHPEPAEESSTGITEPSSVGGQSETVGVSGDPKQNVHLFVLGGQSVGKTTIVDVLQGFASRNGVRLNIREGPSSAGESLAQAIQSCVPLIVWDASRASHLGSLVEYIAEHILQLARALVHQFYTLPLLTSGQTKGSPQAVGADATLAIESRVAKTLAARKLVVCNKSDVQPCPLPEVEALEPSTIFLAGSAMRGTNMKELWRLVETCAAPRPDAEEALSKHDQSQLPQGSMSFRHLVRYSSPQRRSMQAAHDGVDVEPVDD